MRTIVTESEACNIQELIGLFELTDREIEDCEIRDLFNCDPDYFNWGINGSLTKIPFVEVLDKYIIVPDDYVIEAVSDYTIQALSEKCKLMLQRFFEDNFKTYFTEVQSTWENFYSLSFGIAYRGGSGYSYGIWRYNNKK